MAEDKEMLEAIAREHGFSLFKQYDEKEVAHLVSVDLSTLKRWRAEKLTAFIPMGPRKIRYLGLHVARMLAQGVKGE